MIMFPITPLVREVQDLIIQTFEVSEQAALEYAAEFVALAEGWGSPETAAALDWTYRIKKDLGETGKLKWRSEAVRIEFEKTEKQKYAEWDKFVNSQPPRPFGS